MRQAFSLQFTGIGLVSLLPISLVWAGKLQIWLTELHVFISLLCLFGWEFELAEIKSASESHGRVFNINLQHMRASLSWLKYLRNIVTAKVVSINQKMYWTILYNDVKWSNATIQKSNTRWLHPQLCALIHKPQDTVKT